MDTVELERLRKQLVEKDGIIQQQRKQLTQRDDHIQRLQDRCGELLERCRGVSFQVREFHYKFNRPVNRVPAFPSGARIRHRARLILEESFEFLEAQFNPWKPEPWLLSKAFKSVSTWIDNAPITDDRFVDVVDALGDIDYVVEGTRAEYGFDGWPIAQAIHAANMRKEHTDSDEKVIKPPGWQGPEREIHAALIQQGWKP